MTYIIVRETDTGTTVEGLTRGEVQSLSRVWRGEGREEASRRFVFDRDVTSLINILASLGKTK